MPEEPKIPLLSNKIYDVLVFVAQILLPAAGSLYFALAGVWGFSNADTVVGTIVVVDTFLGALLGLNKLAYNSSEAKYDGTMEVFRTVEGKKTFSLNLNSDPQDLDQKKEVIFKVDPKDLPDLRSSQEKQGL